MKHITDDQTEAAVTAAQREFECWRFIEMGLAGYRIIREEKLKINVDATATMVTMVTFDTWPLPYETEEKAQDIFGFLRTRACMRKALETLC